MAITVEQDNQGGGILRAFLIIMVVGLLGWGIYYLFTGPTPEIEDVVSLEDLEAVTSVSSIEIDPNTVLNNPVYKVLIERIGEPIIGEFGRENPFVKF